MRETRRRRSVSITPDIVIRPVVTLSASREGAGHDGGGVPRHK